MSVSWGAHLKPGERLWTSQDDEILKREVAAGTTIEDIAVRTGRTLSAIRNRAYILRLRLPGPKKPKG
jgi:hypothetical protein